MALSESRKKANENYLNKLDEIKIRVPKGRKAEIQAIAESNNESVNSYVIKAIEQRIERDIGN